MSALSGGFLLRTQFYFDRLAFHSVQQWPGLRLTLLGSLLRLGQGVHHGHVNIEVVGLLEALPALVTSKLQLCLRLVFGHVVLEGGPLSALEAAYFTPGEGKQSTKDRADLLSPSFAEVGKNVLSSLHSSWSLNCIWKSPDSISNVQKALFVKKSKKTWQLLFFLQNGGLSGRVI